MNHVCPACGFPNLTEAPLSRSGGGSYEICPSCGFQFGVSDADKGHSFTAWRTGWKKNGMKWTSKGIAAPLDWDPAKQLRLIERRDPPAVGENGCC